jgi:hypothetical protein
MQTHGDLLMSLYGLLYCSARHLAARLNLIVVAAAILLVPFTIRAANRLALVELGPGLPAIARYEYAATRSIPGDIHNLRSPSPQWVFIGDSMVGTRVDPRMSRQIFPVLEAANLKFARRGVVGCGVGVYW